MPSAATNSTHHTQTRYTSSQKIFSRFSCYCCVQSPAEEMISAGVFIQALCGVNRFTRLINISWSVKQRQPEDWIYCSQPQSPSPEPSISNPPHTGEKRKAFNYIKHNQVNLAFLETVLAMVKCKTVNCCIWYTGTHLSWWMKRAQYLSSLKPPALNKVLNIKMTNNETNQCRGGLNEWNLSND